MGQAIYIADPAVAAAYNVHPGEFAYVADQAEAAWLLSKRHGFSIEQRQALPAAFFVHPDAPLPFVAYTAPAPPAPTPPAPPPKPPAPPPAPCPPAA